MNKIVNDVTIIGNNHQYPIVNFYELPKKYQKIMINAYLGGYSDDMERVQEYLDGCSFVVYRYYVYNLCDIMRYDGDLGDFNGYESDTFFSGVLFKCVDDETMLCFHYYS